MLNNFINRRNFNLSLCATAGLASCAQDPGAKLIGKQVPDLKVKAIDGKEYQIGQLKRPAVFHFFGLWCPTCLKDRENWQAAAKQIAKMPEIEFLTFHVGKVPDMYGSINDWYEKIDNDLKTPMIYDESKTVFDAMKIPGTPSTLLIDSGGRIIEHCWDLKSKRGVHTFIVKTKEVLGVK